VVSNLVQSVISGPLLLSGGSLTGYYYHRSLGCGHRFRGCGGGVAVVALVAAVVIIMVMVIVVGTRLTLSATRFHSDT
jgi:hypothetical protein